MVVVPTFSERLKSEDWVVPALVSRVEWLRTPDVANGVHRPRHVVHQKHSDQSAPDEIDVCPRKRAAQDGAEHDRQRKSEEPKYKEPLVDQFCVRVVAEPFHSAYFLGWCHKHPSHMRVNKALQKTPKSRLVQMRRVRVAFSVGATVMF